MKIAIVKNNQEDVTGLHTGVEACGQHEIMDIFVTTSDLPKTIASRVIGFQTRLLLLDHKFSSFTGEEVSEELIKLGFKGFVIQISKAICNGSDLSKQVFNRGEYLVQVEKMGGDKGGERLWSVKELLETFKE